MVAPFSPSPDPGRTLPAKAGQTTPENPWPLRLLAQKMREYVDRMPPLWVEAQVMEYKPRPGTRMSFFVVRDVQADVSINVTAFPGVVEGAGAGFEAGSKVILHVKPNFWETRGTLSLRAAKILVEGEGDFLARIEQLRKQLAAEGLFSNERKRPLPFLPRKVGLICGREAKAKEDVIVNALARWPNTQFVVREVAVQGERSAGEVGAALLQLDQDPDVDVIVITRGGGSVEDLLPFSDERLVRTAAQCSTPIVSAIGHEEDAPLLDFVADYRASTPTDAARKIVPDWGELSAEQADLVSRVRGAVNRRIEHERSFLLNLTNRPVFTRPAATIEQQSAWVESEVVRMSSAVTRRLGAEQSQLSGLQASLSALSPQATLSRGYTILRLPDGKIVRSASDLGKGDLLEGVLGTGTAVVRVMGTNEEGTIFPTETTESDNE